MEVIFAIEAIHQPNVHKYQNNERVNGPLLGKPKAQRKPTHFDLVEALDKKDPQDKRHDKPHQEQAQQEVLQSICDILIAGGYFRARLNIDPFDKVNIELKYNLDSWRYLLVHHW